MATLTIMFLLCHSPFPIWLTTTAWFHRRKVAVRDFISITTCGAKAEAKKILLLTAESDANGLKAAPSLTYFGDGGCHVHNDNSQWTTTPDHWSRSVAGPVEKCEHPEKATAKAGAKID